jgi:ABC transporter substrate binding protein
MRKPTAGRGSALRFAAVMGACAAVLLLACTSAATDRGTQKITAVLSSELGPYREALEGFQETVGQRVVVILAGSSAPNVREARIVVAFGGKAAMLGYPEDAALVYCMAPGMDLRRSQRNAPTLKIELLPHPDVVLAGLRIMQPSMKRLAVIWSSDGSGPYVREIQRAARRLGIELLSERLKSGDELPDVLRSFAARKAEALWLAPDPVLINPENFVMIRSFATTNRIPFYAPTQGLVELGAVAAISASFRSIGRSAGRIALLAQEGRIPDGNFYPDSSDLSINVSAATACGLRLSPEVLRFASKTFR